MPKPTDIARRLVQIRVQAGVLLAASMLLTACNTLLPHSKTEIVSHWNSHDEAAQALSALLPYEATRKDVHAAGLDPRRNPGITILHYADLLQKFSAATLIGQQDVDQGIRDCLHAGKHCNAYQISVKKLDRQRTGDFWLDSLNFKRETRTVGWSIEALLVFVDDQLVYQLIGGQPTIQDYDVQRNPLGPLQGWGSRVGGRP